MAKKIDDLKTMSSNEIVDYLYKVGLSNVFDNYNKSANALNQAKKQQTENAYYLDQMNKRYLGEYASNVGLNDLSTSLQGIANDYAKNLSGVNQNYDLANAELSDAYNKQTQELYNSYAVDILGQRQQEEQANQQLANQILEQALTSGFYGYNEDGSLMNLEQFLNQNQYENLSDFYKNYLKSQERYNKEMADLSSFTIDELNTETGLRIDKDKIADYLYENIDDYNGSVTKGEIKRYLEKGKSINLKGQWATIGKNSVGITDSAGNYYASVEESVSDMQKKERAKTQYENLTGSTLPTNADLTNQYEENNQGARPIKDVVMQYKDDSGHYNYFYYDGKEWHYMHAIGSATKNAAINGINGIETVYPSENSDEMNNFASSLIPGGTMEQYKKPSNGNIKRNLEKIGNWFSDAYNSVSNYLQDAYNKYIKNKKW